MIKQNIHHKNYQKLKWRMDKPDITRMNTH